MPITALLLLAGLAIASGEANPPGNDGLKRRENDSGSTCFIVDGHTHDLVPRNGKPPAQSELGAMLDAGVRGAILAFPLNPAHPDQVIERIERDLEYVNAYAKSRHVEIRFVNRFSWNPADPESKTVQILPAVEYFDGLFSGSPQRLNDLKRLGIRAITLVDSGKERISDDGKRLNKLGAELIRRMNGLNMAIDISHLSEPMQMEVIEASAKPVFASHSNCRAVVPSGRNLSDRVVTSLARKRGMVLLTFDREYLCDRPTACGIDSLIRHMRHLSARLGMDRVGLGSDYGGSGRNAPDEMSSIGCFARILQRLEAAGFPAGTVKGIMGGNIVDFFSTD